MQAIILCGGLGTRLREAIKDVPKPMAPINGTPFMQLQLDRLKEAGANKVVFAVGYKKEIIQDYFHDEYKGMKLCYSEEDKPLGTGGALKKALKLIDEDCAIVMNGDVYLNINLKAIYNQHIVSKVWETMAVKPMTNFNRYGNAFIDGIKMIDYREKEQTEKGFVHIGCYVVQKNIFDAFPELGDSFSHETDYLAKQVKNRRHNVYIYNGYFVDIGIPKDYFEFIEYFTNNENRIASSA